MAVSDDLAFAANEFRQLAEFFESEGNSVFGNMIRAAEARMRCAVALEAAEAVRGGDAAPPAGTVAVRVAVAFNADGVPGIRNMAHSLSAEDALAELGSIGYGRPSCIATIHAPLRDVPEVGAVVEGMDRG